MDSLLIRMAKEEDLDEIFAIEDSVEDAWSYELVKQDLLENKYSVYIVGVLDEKVVGFISIMNIASEVHINNVAVDESHRGKGIGEKLLSYGMNFYPEKEIIGITLEVRVDNYPAIALYEKMGFVTVGIRTGYYKNNKDAYVMWKMTEEN
ncbi:MAG: ribosomal protein S18-alanine N-acetyltransferase [Tissierellia bacterium]|nr:ribosomal protein S18-alanine N-acetyltransferase [Tissierellia bacterium]